MCTQMIVHSRSLTSSQQLQCILPAVPPIRPGQIISISPLIILSPGISVIPSHALVPIILIVPTVYNIRLLIVHNAIGMPVASEKHMLGSSLHRCVE